MRSGSGQLVSQSAESTFSKPVQTVGCSAVPNRKRGTVVCAKFLVEAEQLLDVGGCMHMHMQAAMRVEIGVGEREQMRGGFALADAHVL